MKLAVAALLIFFIAIGLFGIGAIPAMAEIKPKVVSLTWQLEVTVAGLRPISIKTPGKDKAEIYWYAPYKVTNRTGDEQIFVPSFELYTNTGQVTRSGLGVPMAAFDAIQKHLNEPLLRDQTEMTGKILQGRDNAKRGVAIFKDIDPKAGKVDLFIEGLSGESAPVPLPMPIKVKRINDDGETIMVEVNTIILSKTLRLRYTLNGDYLNRTGLTARQNSKQDWVMR
ncbi:MAG TPA: hypothetical protein ENL03_00595 [Phycisphaerae bacterium]|nr:hypothetical protein [Phycisphaerae bacterium]